MAYIGAEPQIGNYQICDAISVVNGQAAYTMQVGSANVVPESANHMIVSLNGVIQKPGSSFTIAGSTITFSSNLATGDSIDFIYLLGNVLDLGTPSDGTVTNAKLGTDLISGETDIGGAIADADLFLIDDGAGGTLRKTAASRIKTYAGGGIFESALLHVRDEKSAGTDGGGSSGGSVQTRDLNTVVTNEISGASLGSNQITLPSGTYYIDAYSNGYACNLHRLFLYNTSDSSYTIMGSTGYARTTNAHQTITKVVGRFTIAAEKVFDLRQYFGSTQSGSGFGVSENASRTEYYTNVQIWKVA